MKPKSKIKASEPASGLEIKLTEIFNQAFLLEQAHQEGYARYYFAAESKAQRAALRRVFYYVCDEFC